MCYMHKALTLLNLLTSRKLKSCSPSLSSMSSSHISAGQHAVWATWRWLGADWRWLGTKWCWEQNDVGSKIGVGWR